MSSWPLAQLAIRVQDVDRATAFYRDVLEIPFLFSAPPSLSFFQAGPVRLMLSQDGADGNSVPYFLVESLDAELARLEGKAEIVDKPHKITDMADHELWMMFLKDSEGNTLGLMEERR